MIRGIHHFALHTPRFDAMKRFYREAFGFEQAGPEIRWTPTPEGDATIGVKNGCAMQYADSPTPRMSAGASIIWDSPFGPLRFDFAYPFLKQPYDRTQWFQFGGGTRF